MLEFMNVIFSVFYSNEKLSDLHFEVKVYPILYICSVLFCLLTSYCTYAVGCFGY